MMISMNAMVTPMAIRQLIVTQGGRPWGRSTGRGDHRRRVGHGGDAGHGGDTGQRGLGRLDAGGRDAVVPGNSGTGKLVEVPDAVVDEQEREDERQDRAGPADHRADRQRRAPLQAPTTLDRQLIGRYDVPPYVNSADQSGAVPFLDIGNRYILAGAQYNPQVLAGLSAAQIAAKLRDPASPAAQAVDGAAQVIIAAINQVLHDQPVHG